MDRPHYHVCYSDCPDGLTAGSLLSRSGLTAIAAALNSASEACRFHGVDYGRLGFQNGLPRCESCRQPYQITRAREALHALGTPITEKENPTNG